MKRKNDEYENTAIGKQGELFSEFQTAKIKGTGRSFGKDMVFAKKVVFSLSYENIILLFIGSIMLLVIFFSLGVEKGKRSTIAQAGGEKAENVISEAPQKEEPKIAKNSEITEKKVIDIPQKLYTIQVSAFRKEGKAEKEIARLKNNGYDTFVMPSEGWLQVCVGRYASREESEKDFAALKKNYPSCYFRKIEE